LIVKIEKPYGFITPKPINITIDKTSWTYDVKIHLVIMPLALLI